MKKRSMNLIKTTMAKFAFALIFALTLTACNTGSNTSNSTFPNIDDASIPDILETTVGTLGDVYFTSGITDNKDYRSYLAVTFNNTTEDDYAVLMEHYQSTSTVADENGVLLFDWGKLQVTFDNGIINVSAYIQQ